MMRITLFIIIFALVFIGCDNTEKDYMFYRGHRIYKSKKHLTGHNYREHNNYKPLKSQNNIHKK